MLTSCFQFSATGRICQITPSLISIVAEVGFLTTATFGIFSYGTIYRSYLILLVNCFDFFVLKRDL